MAKEKPKLEKPPKYKTRYITKPFGKKGGQSKNSSNKNDEIH